MFAGIRMTLYFYTLSERSSFKRHYKMTWVGTSNFNGDSFCSYSNIYEV